MHPVEISWYAQAHTHTQNLTVHDALHVASSHEELSNPQTQDNVNVESMYTPTAPQLDTRGRRVIEYFYIRIPMRQ